MEALLFARHVFGIQAFDPLALSRRCWGAGAARLAKAVCKAAGLRVSDLEALHRILDTSANPWDRLFAGCALFCVYARCRWSDAQHVDSFRFDQGPDSDKIEYIEALVDVHKNMNRRGKAPVLLELVASGLGVCSEDWIEKFLDARSALGLTSDHAFMPAPDVTGAPTIRALDSDECSEWLLRLLPPRLGLKTSSHSLKGTLLSMCAKWGIKHVDRLAMGGHSHPGRMSDEYADDAMARPLRLIEMVIRAIRSGRFHPDATRAGRFVGGEPAADFADLPEDLTSGVPKVRGGAGRPAPSASHQNLDDVASARPSTPQTGALDSPRSGPDAPSPSFVETRQDESDGEAVASIPGGLSVRSPSVAEEGPAAGGDESDASGDSSSSESSSSDSSASVPEPDPARTEAQGGPACRAMALVDSKASFKTRCVDMCGNDTLYQKLAGKDIRTFSDLAFACGTPQSPPSQDDFRNFADEILGVGASLGDTAKLTRLHFEASTYVIAQLKQQVVGDTTDEPKRLPLAENEARYRDLRHRLPGLLIQGELLPSHALVDSVAHMAETNCLTCLAPSKCTKRDQELRLGPKEKSKVLTVLDNSVTVTAQPEKIVADHGTPLQLQWCLQRRGLAFDMNRIISWETHEKWVNHLLQCLTADTVPGYNHITVAQVVKADSEMFLMMSKEIKNVKASSTGEMEADTFMERFRSDPRITMHLLPLPKALSALASEAGDNAHAGTPSPKKKTRRERKTSLAGPVKVENMPKELKECKFFTDHSGRRFCWTHNTGTCNAETDGGSPPACKRGVHACMGCRKPGHGWSSCWFNKVRNEPALQPRDSSDGSARSVLKDPADNNKSTCAFQFSFKPPDGLPTVVDHPAEHLARTCLQQGSGGESMWMQLAELLPGEESSRTVSTDSKEKCFISGAYSRGVAGLRSNCKRYPDSTRLLVRLARIAFPGLCFSSVGLFQNMRTVPHKDHNNRTPAQAPTLNQACFLNFSQVPQALDFTDESECQVVLQMIQDFSESLQYVHLSPPQETCLAARNLDSHAGATSAPPVRSLDQPLGLVSLSDPLRKQVQDANQLYVFCSEVVRSCCKLGIAVSVEAPASPLFWHIPAIKSAFEAPQAHDVDFHECMHGGPRDRKLRWASSVPWFKPLGLLCNRRHTHVHWSATPTAGHKGSYPKLLCARVAEIVLSQVCQVPASTSLFGPASAIVRLAYDKQPRRHHALVSEFGSYDAWAVLLGLSDCPKSLISAYPKGARGVRRKLLQWGQIRACELPTPPSDTLEHCLDSNWRWSLDTHIPPGESDQPLCKVCGFLSDLTFEDSREVIWIGIPRTPEDFVRQAVAAGHPRRILENNMDDRTKLLVDNLLSGRVAQGDLGASKVAEWAQLAKDLEPLEEAQTNSMDPLVGKILAGKKTCLLERLLSESAFPDERLVTDIRKGFSLTGWMPNSGLFVPDPRPPKTSLERQLKSAQARNSATVARVSSQPVDAVAEQTWKETLEEASKGWLFEDPDPDLSSVLVARRFGIVQGAKTRVIDDGKAAGINQTVGLPERFRLHSIDYISAFLVWAMLDQRAKGAKVSGKTVDLKYAYKQYAVCPSDRNIFRIVTLDPVSGKAKFYGAAALPFGTTGSVAGFLRTSAATWHVGSTLMGLSWCNYFDDFPLFSLDENCQCTESCAEGLLDALGITFAREGRKATKFSKECRALGLIIDLSKFGDGIVYIRHTPERIQELRQTISVILDRGTLESSEAEALRGRLHWFSSFLFGRRASQALGVLGLRVKGLDGGKKLSGDLRQALTYLRDRALESPPVQLSPAIKETFYIFTDGSLEGDVAGVGGILYDPLGEPLSFFSGKLPADSVHKLRESSEHPIYEVELLAIWAAFQLWMQQLKDRFVVVYLDNEAAKGALVSGKSTMTLG
ncbi:unnamed protein product [Symbiodinium sp. CCMP2456]|nr:unnamed protein product [Symbiodinium sp. CCMP2456]